MNIFKNCLILAGSFILLNGCSTEPCVPKTKVVEKIVYLRDDVPKPLAPPIGLKYNVEYIKYNDKNYIQMTIEDSNIMLLNYDRFRDWSLSNYKTLLMLNKKSKEK